LSTQKQELRLAINQAIEPSLAKLNSGASVGNDDMEERQRWSVVQSLWAITKEKIDARLEHALGCVSNDHRRRQYDDLNRNDYGSIILQLYKDRFLGGKQTDAALDMYLIYMSKQNRHSPVTQEVYDRFNELQMQWERYDDRRK
jgi:hypothetical protein